ncbi:hypothetical protein OSB04_001025 [Centaurea solstitialis]|uniref:Xyloglucan endotransglucosylase/hydrolase n=1 Tax=Centaurea solstitialis TaxID=347529 RepID=A0AA38TS22_9ASTR|nr:hypothetical protein OSB04_001025 [Centaurea solstitialis]
MDAYSWFKLLIFFQMFFMSSNASKNASFDENYSANWGDHHISFFNHEREVHLLLDPSSGAGFKSKEFFASGYFQMRIKLPGNDSAGVVTAFYVPTNALNIFVNNAFFFLWESLLKKLQLYTNATVHDELDFEFLGNRPGKPITLQTNVFSNGVGGREQKTNLWFDPTADFHYYKMLWNQHQIVFFVNDVPIRVFKNNTNKGVRYPIGPMQVMVSLWDGSDWATDGGTAKANYSNGPIQAHFQDFDIDGCPSTPTGPNKDCYSSNYWWNNEEYRQLNPDKLKVYDTMKKKHTTYDYCTDTGRYPTPPPECIR